MSSQTSKVWKIALFVGVFFVMMSLVGGVFAATFENPIKAQNLEELVETLSQAILKLAFVLAPIFILITGFRFVTAAATGNIAKISEAKKLFLWTLVGTAIIVGASVIATAIINFAKNL